MQILLRAFLILLILTIAAALFIVLYKRMRPVRNAHFICPNCGAVTMPGKWARALAPARAGNRLLQCPACGKFSYMSPVFLEKEKYLNLLDN